MAVGDERHGAEIGMREGSYRRVIEAMAALENAGTMASDGDLTTSLERMSKRLSAGVRAREREMSKRGRSGGRLIISTRRGARGTRRNLFGISKAIHLEYSSAYV